MRSRAIVPTLVAVAAASAGGAIVASVTVAAAAGAGGANAAAGARGANRPRLILRHPLPQAVRQDQILIVRGRIHGGRPVSRTALEGRQTHGGPKAHWKVVAAAAPGADGRFVLRWKVGRRHKLGPLLLRVVAQRRGRITAATRTRQSFVGPAPVYCAAPSPPAAVPAGDGWIVGGAYLEGGPYPGIYECSSQAYTITATDEAGQVAASQRVAGGHSYTLVVPAGRYSLKASSCGFGSATVTAGKQTHADAVCPVP